VQRTAQNKNYNVILQQSRKNPGQYRVGAIVITSILQLLLIYLAVGLAGIYGLVLLMEPVHSFLPAGDHLPWPHLILIASISAVAALRIKKAYVSMIVGIGVISAYFLWEITAI